MANIDEFPWKWIAGERTLVEKGKNRRHVFMSSQERRVRELRSCFALYISLFIYLFIYFPIFIQDLPLQQGWYQ